MLLRLSVQGVAEFDACAALLGVSRSEVLRRALAVGLPRVQEQARAHVETGATVL